MIVNVFPFYFREILKDDYPIEYVDDEMEGDDLK